MIHLSSMHKWFVAAVFFFFGNSILCSAQEMFVALDGNNISPYTNWANAATDIYSAIRISSDGDSVCVSNGTYTITSPVALTNFNITLYSLNGPAETVIDAQGNSSVINVTDGSTVDGFTLTNGYMSGLGEPGGGIRINNGIIQNCHIVDCNATYGGGGIVGSDGILRDSYLYNNTSLHAGGGLIISDNGTVENCFIYNNSIPFYGSATNIQYGGGGVLIYNGGHITECIISNNYSIKNGGGVHVIGNGEIEQCSILYNSAGEHGGGVECESGGFLQSCLITDNISSNGGGVYIITNGTVQNCTIADNTASNGGGVFFFDGGECVNSILYYNTAGNGTNILVHNDGLLHYCSVNPLPGGAYDGGGNVTNIPDFVNRPNDNYRLLPSSFAIDSGTNLPNIFEYIELDGKCRVSNIVDRGAYELNAYSLPSVSITTMPVVVTYDTAEMHIAGTNNAHTAGDFRAVNSANGTHVSIPRTGTDWTSPLITLAVGTNNISVYSTNVAHHTATDSIIIIRLGVGTGAPYVDITNENTTVYYDIDELFISGTNNMHVTGEMWITNAHNGYNNRFYSTVDDWFSINIPLATGTNMITVFCTNALNRITNDTVYIYRQPGTGAPFVHATTDISYVSYDVASISIAGTNNGQVAGMWLFSSHTGMIPFAAADSWITPPVPLHVGQNVIDIYGTNTVLGATNDTIIITRGIAGTGMPFVDCTNAHATVPNSMTTIVLTGTNNPNVVGTMWAVNPLNGITKRFAATSHWATPAITLDEGLNDIQIAGTNMYGESYDDLVLITRKGPATGTPFVDITTTSMWCTYDAETITVTGTNNEHVTGAMWISNDVTHTVRYFSSAAIWTSAPIPLVVGNNELRVTGQNAEGTQAVDHISIVRGVPGTGVPYIEITNANRYVTYDYTTWEIGGLANSNVLGILVVSNMVNTTTTTCPAENAWRATALPIIVGTNTFIVHGTNMFGEKTFATAAIIREPPGSGIPFLDVTTTNKSVSSDTTSISLDGTNNPNVVGYMWVTNRAIGFTESFTANDTWTTPPVPLQIGWNDIVVFGTNYNGIVTQDVVRITRGTPGYGSPTVTITTTNSVVTYDNDSITIHGTVNYNVMGGMWLSNSLNSTVVTFDATQYWSATVSLAAGNNVITAFGTNYLDETATDSCTITRLPPGTGAPFIEITNTVYVVPHTQDTYIVAGTNNANVVGYMWLSNTSDSTVHSFAAQPSWSAPSVTLARHINELNVYGTNQYGDLASDFIFIDRPVPSGVTNYVSSTGSNEWPYITLATAATNLETALSDTVSGNMVLVYTPTNYLYNQYILDKDIILKSANGKDSTFIAIRNTYPTAPLRMSHGSIDGFTFINAAHTAGMTTNGGCLYIEKDATLQNCRFSGFNALNNGGAVYCNGGNIMQCEFIHNFALGVGGALFVNEGGYVDESSFTTNYATRGGGVYLSNSGTVSHCSFIGNYAVQSSGGSGGSYENAGGGVYCDNGGLVEYSDFHYNYSRNGAAAYILSDGIVSRCTISKNTAVYYAAVYCQYGGLIDACVIKENTALSGAGAAFSSAGVIRNSLVINNSANDGAGINAEGNVIIDSCTISSNTADDTAGGIYVTPDTHIRNTIIYGNAAQYNSNYYSTGAEPTFEYSCTAPVPTGTGNISAAPDMANPFTGYFKLAADSPCINAGTNITWHTDTHDVRGVARTINSRIDIGAYEFTNEPIIWLSLSHIDYGDVTVDTTVTSTFSIGNAGTDVLTSDIHNVDNPFTIPEGTSFVIPSMDTETVVVHFTPTEETNYYVQLNITGNDGGKVHLTGTGIPEPGGILLISLLIGILIRHRT